MANHERVGLGNSIWTGLPARGSTSSNSRWQRLANGQALANFPERRFRPISELPTIRPLTAVWVRVLRQ